MANKEKRTPAWLIEKALNPKKIIMNAIKEKLSGTGIIKVILVFFLDSEKYNLMLQNATGESMNVDVTKDEITTIKKLFVRRIISKWNEKYDIEPKDIIIQIDVENENIEIFIGDYKDKVHKFDF